MLSKRFRHECWEESFHKIFTALAIKNYSFQRARCLMKPGLSVWMNWGWTIYLFDRRLRVKRVMEFVQPVMAGIWRVVIVLIQGKRLVSLRLSPLESLEPN